MIHDCKRLRTMKRSCNSALKQSRITTLEKSVQSRVAAAKSKFEFNLISNLAKSRVCSKIFKYTRSITGSNSFPSTVFLDSETASLDFDKASLFNQFFYSVFLPNQSNPSQPSEHPKVKQLLRSISITDMEVYTALSSLDPFKAHGIDEVGPRILRSCALALYVPLHHLFCLSLSCGFFPLDWCTHVITPLYKSGDKSSVKNYRPISLLPTVSKVFERLVYDKVFEFVSPYISSQQFGFLPNQSTLQQLLISLHKISNSYSAHTQTDVIYLDIKKAFDSISHSQLLDKLWSMGICGSGSNPIYVIEGSVFWLMDVIQAFSQSCLECPREVFWDQSFS